MAYKFLPQDFSRSSFELRPLNQESTTTLSQQQTESREPDNGTYNNAVHSSRDSPSSDTEPTKDDPTIQKWPTKEASPWFRHVWIPEYLAAFISLACQAAIAIELAVLHGKTLSSWKLPISPNALISVFSTISKSCMLLTVAQGIGQLKWLYFQAKPQRLRDFKTYDDAVQGPWGSARLIQSVNVRDILASFGALIVILSLAMDPFVQQIIHYRTDLVESKSDAAIIAATKAFDSGTFEEPASTQASLAGLAQYSITTGSSDLINSLVRGLFSENTETSYTCPSGNCTWPAFSSLGVCSTCEPRNSSDMCNEMSCGYRSFDPQPYGTNASDQEHLYTYAMVPTSQGCGSQFAQIGIIYHDEAARSWEEEPAYSCSLHLCKKTYEESKYTLDVLIDKPSKSEPLSLLASPPPAPGNNSALCAYSVNTTTSSSKRRDEDDIYWVNTNDMSVVGAALVPLFWSTLRTTLGGNNYVASALHRRNGGDIRTTMDGVATSMTNQMRAGPNSTEVHGTALIPEPYIHVEWLWLILPLALVLLSLVFLTLTILISSRRGNVVWKSSTLATLFHSMHGIKSDESRLRSEATMEHVSRQVYTILQIEEDGRMALVYAEKQKAG